MPWIEIFKAGKYPQSEITEEDLDAAIANYDTSFFQAPVKLDHVDEGRAYGWVKALKREGKSLFAELEKVSEDLKKLVNDGAYKNRSVEFYKNLEGKGLYLRGVAFLGAAPPAVKGMAPVQFSEYPDGDYLAFSMDTNIVASVFRRLREWLIGKFDQNTADTIVPDYQIDMLKSEPEEDVAMKENLYTKPKEKGGKNMPTVEELQKEIATLKASEKAKDATITTKDAEIAKFKEDARKGEIDKFASELIASGKLLPKDKDNFVAFAMALDETKTIKFADGQKNGVEFFKEFMKTIPEKTFADVSGKETLTKDKANESNELAMFSDEQRTALDKKIKALQKANPSLSYSEAFDEILRVEE